MTSLRTGGRPGPGAEGAVKPEAASSQLPARRRSLIPNALLLRLQYMAVVLRGIDHDGDAGAVVG